jgi:hypothetical protein
MNLCQYQGLTILRPLYFTFKKYARLMDGYKK